MLTMRRLFGFRGEISGKAYFLWGVLLFALKYPLDALVAERVFGVDWHPLVYFSINLNPLFHATATRPFWLGMLLVALPFLWAGLSLTVQRLRALRAAPGLAILFFLPFLNMVFFMTLVFLRTPDPCAPAPGPPPSQAGPPRLLERLIPQSAAACLLASLGLSLAGAGLTYALCIRVGIHYGSTIFLAVPFAMGYFTVTLLGYRRELTVAGALGYSILPILIASAMLVALAIEGLPCVLMALPVVCALAALGGWIAHLSMQAPWQAKGKLMCAFLVPLALLADAALDLAAGTPRALTSTVIVEAPPEHVWQALVAFPPITAPQEDRWLFDLFHIPRLERAAIAGQGVGAIRRCIFHSGTFVEPVEVWTPGRELAFGVTAQPARLHDCLTVTRGAFVLTPLSAGRTRVDGTTWYAVNMFPAPYWALWVDGFVHRIHMRALEHVRALAERVERAGR